MRTTTIRDVMSALGYAFIGISRPRQALLLEAGQTLVLNYATLTADEGDRIKARIRADYPGLPVLLVCADTIGVKSGTTA